MAKKEKLDKNKADRLEKLLKGWEKAGEKDDYLLSEKITLLDLRLLLENPSPLRDLMNQIVEEYLRDKSTDQPIAVGIEQTVPATCMEDTQVQRHPAITLQRDQADFTQAQSDLKAFNKQVETLQKKEDDYKQDIKALKEKCKQLQAELAATQANSIAVPALDFLRSDPQLAQLIGLTDLSQDNTQALIQTVAVLAQIDNLKRLWEILKERCEHEKRAATNNECALLQASLDWNNHNWRSLPYRLIDTVPGSRYDYESQSRSRHITKGETVVAMLLSGIADGSGKVLCKALVQTK